MAGFKNELLRDVNCVCPMCGKSFTKKAEYVGREPARYFCYHCKNSLVHDNMCYREDFIGQEQHWPSMK